MPMPFRKLLASIADCLDAKHEGMTGLGQNPQDIGEIREVFVREFLHDVVSDLFNINRGGKVINSLGNASGQVDIVLTDKRALRLFTDKGIYPVETVWSVFCVTSNLTRTKFDTDLRLLQTLPLNHYQFHFRGDPDIRCFDDGTHKVTRFDPKDYCHRRGLYGTVRCIFGFTGDIEKQWADDLNSMLQQNLVAREHLPDIVVVNKRGMIYGENVMMAGREFHYEDLRQPREYHKAIGRILHRLFILNAFNDASAFPAYDSYFIRD